jgi:hypothetical protein
MPFMTDKDCLSKSINQMINFSRKDQRLKSRGIPSSVYYLISLNRSLAIGRTQTKTLNDVVQTRNLEDNFQAGAVSSMPRSRIGSSKS